MSIIKSVAEAEEICTLVTERVRLVGLTARPELNGQWGNVGYYVASRGRYAVEMDGSANGDLPLVIKRDNLERLALGRATPEELARCDMMNKLAMAESNKDQIAEEGAESKPRATPKKKIGRGGIATNICPCCDGTMTLCETVKKEYLSLEEVVRVLSSLDKTQGLGAEGIVEAVYNVMDAVSSGYATLRGCQCDHWSAAPILSAMPELRGASGCCEHLGNNPLQRPLPSVLDADIAGAVLNIAWRNEERTRFAAVRLFMLHRMPAAADLHLL